MFFGCVINVLGSAEYSAEPLKKFAEYSDTAESHFGRFSRGSASAESYFGRFGAPLIRTHTLILGHNS